MRRACHGDASRLGRVHIRFAGAFPGPDVVQDTIPVEIMFIRERLRPHQHELQRVSFAVTAVAVETVACEGARVVIESEIRVTAASSTTAARTAIKELYVSDGIVGAGRMYRILDVPDRGRGGVEFLDVRRLVAGNRVCDGDVHPDRVVVVVAIVVVGKFCGKPIANVGGFYGRAEFLPALLLLLWMPYIYIYS